MEHKKQHYDILKGFWKEILIENVFIPADDEEIYLRKRDILKNQLNDLNMRFGTLEVGDYVTPLESYININPTNRKLTGVGYWRSDSLLVQSSLYKIIEISEYLLVLEEIFKKKFIKNNLDKSNNLSSQFIKIPKNERIIFEINPLTLKEELYLNVFHKGALQERFGLNEDDEDNNDIL